MYPNRVDMKALKWEPLRDDENVAMYVEKQLRKWRADTERDVLADPIINSMFRAAVLEGIPTPARSKLEEIVGLESKAYREFIDHVVDVVEIYRKEEKNVDKQLKEVQRKRLQAQLEELKKQEKGKEDLPDKKMAPIATDLVIEETPELGRGGEGVQSIITYHISGCQLPMNPLGFIPNYQNWTPRNQNDKGPGNN